MTKQRITISDVAKKAGVSPTAVSFAFNKPEQLGKETLERIFEAARELGYAANPYARALHSGSIGSLGVLVPQSISSIFSNPFFAAFLQGMGVMCDEKGIGLLTLAVQDNNLEAAIAKAPVDGFVLVGLNEDHEEVAPLIKRNIPTVIVDGDGSQFSTVNVDDEGGAYQAAKYLLDQGHRDIRIVTFETPYNHLEYVYFGVGGRRLRGYQRAFQEAGLDWNDEYLVPTIASIEGGQDSFMQLMAQKRQPSAVLAVSDAMAIGVVSAAKQANLRIPQDLAVIGFDDIPLAELMSPALSTVNQPVTEKGRLAADLLISALEEGQHKAQHFVLPTTLILRDTTR